MLAQNVGIGTTNPTEKLEVNGIIFAIQGGIKFPDGSIQTTAYQANNPPDTNLTALVIEFPLGFLPPGPAQGPGITDGINVNDISYGIETTTTLDGGGVNITDPSFTNLRFGRDQDHLSSDLQFLVANGDVIPYIKVFYLRIINDDVYIDHKTTYENCVLNNYSGSAWASNIQYGTHEEISFFFTKACYTSYVLDQFSIPTGQRNDSCWDRESTLGGCTCSF